MPTASLYTLKMVVKEDVCRFSFLVNVCFGHFSGARKLLNFMGVASDGETAEVPGQFLPYVMDPSVRQISETHILLSCKISELLPKNRAEIRRNSDVGKIL